MPLPLTNSNMPWEKAQSSPRGKFCSAGGKATQRTAQAARDASKGIANSVRSGAKLPVSAKVGAELMNECSAFPNHESTAAVGHGRSIKARRHTGNQRHPLNRDTCVCSFVT